VLTAFVAKDTAFVNSWLRDIARQRALSIFSVELVIGYSEPEAFEIIAMRVTSMLAALGELARVSIALFEGDPGMYGIWDAIMERPSCAPIVTNWNVDDRKRPDSLLARLNAMSVEVPEDPAHPNQQGNLPGVVTSDVLLYTAQPLDRALVHPCTWQTGFWQPGWSMGHGEHNDHADWPTMLGCYAWDAPRIYSMRLFSDIGRSKAVPKKRASTRLHLTDLLLLEKSGRWPGGYKVVGSQNVPHSSPMWRKAMHEQLGGFASRDGNGCYDFSFWLKALTHNYIVWHMAEPLEMNLVRASSHGHHRHAREAAKQNDSEWVNECDPPETWAANRQAVLDSAWHIEYVEWYEEEIERAIRVRSKRLWWAWLISILLACASILSSLLWLRQISPLRRSEIYCKVLHFARMQLAKVFILPTNHALASRFVRVVAAILIVAVILVAVVMITPLTALTTHTTML